MKALMLVCMSVFLSSNLPGQVIPDKFQIYRVKVIGQDHSFKSKGALYAVTDSSIVISDSFTKKDYHSGKYVTSTILVKSIMNLKVTRHGSTAKGASIGFASGALAGLIIGFAAGDDTPCNPMAPGPCLSYTAGQKALINTAILGSVGTFIGAILGAQGKKFYIYGNLDRYNYREELVNRSIVEE